jgi:hypothetical protein
MSQLPFARLTFCVAVAAVAVFVIACDGGGQSSETPKASPKPSGTATVEPSATLSRDEEISQAYLRFWDAYSKALLELDPALAKDVAAGNELDRIANEIESLQAQGLALRVRVEHNLVIVEASEVSATVTDAIVNNSFYVDAITKQPPEASGSEERFNDTYRLDKVDGRWIVTDGSRQR